MTGMGLAVDMAQIEFQQKAAIKLVCDLLSNYPGIQEQALCFLPSSWGNILADAFFGYSRIGGFGDVHKYLHPLGLDDGDPNFSAIARNNQAENYRIVFLEVRKSEIAKKMPDLQKKLDYIHSFLKMFCEVLPKITQGGGSSYSKALSQAAFIAAVAGQDNTNRTFARDALFTAFYQHPALNSHRNNPRFDWFFSKKNTNSWQATIKTVRKQALVKLYQDMDELQGNENKCKLLETAIEMPLFNIHRSNYFRRGDTATVKDIKSKMRSLSAPAQRLFK